MSEQTPSPAPLKVLVYASSSEVRQHVALALGRTPAPDLGPIEIVEAATAPAVTRHVDTTRFAAVILDGEAQPAGGLGVCRTIKEEVFQAPPILVLIGRPQDDWLASWSRADAVVAHPIDALELAEAVAGLLRSSAAPAVQG